MSSSPSGNRWLTHYRELLATWSRRAASRADAEDAVQDSMAALLANANAGAIDNPRAYLHRSVHNGLADAHRKSQGLDLQPLDGLSEAEQPASHDPEAPLRTAQLLEAMKAALAELPPKCQQVFLWHRLEGYSQREIADRMGLSVNMVERYMIRATRHLRERLQDHAP